MTDDNVLDQADEFTVSIVWDDNTVSTRVPQAAAGAPGEFTVTQPTSGTGHSYGVAVVHITSITITGAGRVADASDTITAAGVVIPPFRPTVIFFRPPVLNFP